MRKLWKIFIGIEIGVLFLLSVIAIITIVLESKWLTFWIAFTLLIILSIAFLIYIIIKLKPEKIKKQIQIDDEEGLSIITKYIKEKSHDPDNYIILEKQTPKVGNGTPTPILVISCKGTERQGIKVFMLNKITGEINESKRNPSQQEIKEMVISFANFPDEDTPRIERRFDPYGNIIGETVSRERKTYQQKIEEKEQKEADDKNIT